MRWKISVAVVLAVVAGAWLWLPELPDTGPRKDESLPASVDTAARNPAADSTAPSPMDAVDSEAELRRAQMAAAYAELEEKRRELRRRLDGLKSRIWGEHFPPEQAESIGQALMGGYAQLKNPPLQGAFGSVAEVERETAKLDAMISRLAEIEKGIPR